MDYLQFASELPLDQTIVFNSAEENEETMHRLGISQNVKQLGKGKFRSDLVARSEGQAEFFSDRFNKAVSVHLEAPVEMIFFLFPLSASENFKVSGSNVAKDTLLVLPGGSGMDIVVPDLAGSDSIAISKTRFVEMSEALSPTYERPETLSLITGNDQQLRQLRNVIVSLTSNPDIQPGQESISNLLATTIDWLGHSKNQRKPEELVTPKARTMVAKKVQEFIEENYRGPISIENICRRTGVGIRTVQRCFLGYFDLTISEYIKIVRLNSAMRELSTAFSSDTSVTLIALSNGFTHLGRFSLEFQERFGVSPRDTLKGRS